jgi:hypothetical protein
MKPGEVKYVQDMEKPFDVTKIGIESGDASPNDAAGERPSDFSPKGRHDYISDLRSLAQDGKIDRVVDEEERGNEVPEDVINPAHYRKHPSGIECIEVTRHMNFNVGNAIKYLWRYMDKGDPVEHLQKAQWYIDDEIRRLQGLR